MSDQAVTEEPTVLTVAEARKLLRLSHGAAYQGIAKGEIPHIKIGRRILIPAAALRRMLDGNGAAEK